MDVLTEIADDNNEKLKTKFLQGKSNVWIDIRFYKNDLKTPTKRGIRFNIDYLEKLIPKFEQFKLIN